MMTLRHKESGQIVKIYGFAPYQVGGDAVGGDFLIRTSDGWDFRPVEEFEPVTPEGVLQLEDSDD